MTFTTGCQQHLPPTYSRFGGTPSIFSESSSDDDEDDYDGNCSFNAPFCESSGGKLKEDEKSERKTSVGLSFSQTLFFHRISSHNYLKRLTRIKLTGIEKGRMIEKSEQ